MKPKRSYVSGLLSLAFLAAGILALLQRQAIFDWARLRNYQPPAAIAKLATDTTMNDTARNIFYVYHPSLVDRTQFSSHCPNQTEKTIVLGCYNSQTGIYLFDVTDERLAGVEEVTAAHETLHAVYERMNSKEKARMSAVLESAFKTVKDKRLIDTIESYRKAGADVNNELHSILGTEVRDLPVDLEKHYSKYFNDRKKIVGYSERYEKAFSDRKAQADSYLEQMEAIERQLPPLKREIDRMEAELSRSYNALEQDRNSTRDAAAFNARVAEYNRQVAAYSSRVNTYNQLVERHNQILNLYNAVANEGNELIKALDSRPTAVPSQ